MQRRVIPKLTEKERRALRAGRRLNASLEFRAREIVGRYYVRWIATPTMGGGLVESLVIAGALGQPPLANR
jgi:hypothetical protein